MMNILKRVGLGLSLWALVLVGMAPMGCGGSNNNGGGGGVTAIDPVGSYMMTKFFATSTTNPNNVIDGGLKGLSIYFTLNSDHTLKGASEVPEDPAHFNTITGTWSAGDNNQLTVVIIPEGENSTTLSGTLSQTGSEDPVFEASQTAGDPINFGSPNNEVFTITTFGAVHYLNTLTNEDIAGSYDATSGIAISNLNGNDTLNLLTQGNSQSLVLGADGSLNSTIIENNGPPDSVSGTYHIDDDFHLTIALSDLNNGGTQTLPFRIFNGVLTIFIYQTNATFPPATTPVSATQIYEFSPQ